MDSKLSASLMSDENDQNYLPFNLNPRKLEKSEKKVLIERNEAMDLKLGENPVDPKPSCCEELSSRVSDFDRDDKNSSADLSSRPYDPLTNYLSPRPKFLRYKPSRRRELFLRQQNDGAADISVSPTSSSEEELGKRKLQDIRGECGEIDEEIEDEGEGDEEDRGWVLKDLLKFFLTVVSLFLSTFYITSVNTPTPSFEVLRIFESGFCPILNHTDEFGETPSAKGSNLRDEEVTETTSKLNSEGASQFIHPEDAKNIGFMGETEILNGENEDKTAYGHLEKLEDPEQVEEVVETPQVEGEENEVEFSEPTVEDDGDQESVQTSNPSILNEFDQENSLSDILIAVGNEYTSQNEVVEMEEVGDWEMVESNKKEAKTRITIWERTANGISSFVEDLEKLKSGTESVLQVILGLSVSSAILTFLVLSFQFKKKKKVDKKKPTISASVKPPLLQSPLAEAEIKPTCDVAKSNYEHIGKVDEAPTVQFLGEIVVGGLSNSLKNRSGLKNRMIEAEDSSFHVSFEQKPVSKNMNSGPEQALSEFSTTSSPSYGSITTKKKNVNKEVRGDEEAKSIPTPVRRSTRIRNRIISP